MGIERRRLRAGAPESEFNLLVLDPGIPTVRLAAALRTGRNWERLLKRGVHTLDKPEYQLMYIDDGLATGQEFAESRIVHAEEWY